MNIACYSRDEFVAVIAGLVREGIRFRASATSDHDYFIELTGGF